MKITYIYSTLALLILEASAQASGSCDDGIIDIKMAGDHDQSYTLSIPQDGTTVKITNPQIVFSITAPYYPLICPTKCTFIAADGAVNYYSGDTIDPDGLNLDGPQAQVAVACTAANAAEVLCVTATSLTDDTETQSCTAADALAEFPTPKTDVGSSEASTTASASSSSTVATPPTGGSSVASTANSFVPPYPTVTVSATVGSSTRSGVSTGIQATSTGGTGGGNGTFVPFTGAAHRVSAPIEGSLLALMGLVFAL